MDYSFATIFRRSNKFLFVQFTFSLIPLAAILLAVPLTAQAAPAFRWEDGSGHIFFGSNPPGDARNVQKVAGKSFSRYSSDKLLSGYRSRLSTTKPNTKVREEDLKIDVPKEPAIPMPERSTEMTQGSVLQQGPITVKLDAEAQLIGCSVAVKNTTNSEARDVIVTFEFSDGSIVPAFGPEVIAGVSEATYSIPEDQMPLTLGTVAALAARNAPKAELETAARPKVIINQLPPISDQG